MIMELPSGLLYLPDFVTNDEEDDLLVRIAAFETWESTVFRGQVARRKSVSFGHGYVATSHGLSDAPPLPDFLAALRDRAAARAVESVEVFTQAIVWRYPRGSGIGWHRDAQVFGPDVLSLSLGSRCRFELRRDGHETVRMVIEPGSLLAIGGEARCAWQHRIPPVREERHSITFRSIAPGRGRP